jgi:chitodextrinase
VDVNPGSNPSNTEFALYNETAGYYVNASGGNNGSTPVWRTEAAWGVVTVTGLNSNTTYSFKAKARNGDGIETAFGSSGFGTTTSEPPPPNQDPVADAGDDQSASSGNLVIFDASNSYDPDGTIVSYEWDFGDGEIATGIQASHRFRGAMDQPRTYTVTLIVIDDEGFTDSDTTSVTVVPLEKTVQVIHQPIPPVPGLSVFGKVTAIYNWVYDDTYVVSTIRYESEGFLGIGTIGIWDFHSNPVPIPIWATNIFSFSRRIENTYQPRLDEIHYGGDVFKGVAVNAFDVMNIIITGWAGVSISIGPSIPPPFFETESVAFQPESTEASDPPIEMLNLELTQLASPGELRIYDSQGRVTGLVNGEIKQEIPNSAYDNDIIIILSPSNSYLYEVVGTDQGLYGLGVASVDEGNITTFTAFNMPITDVAIHEYTIDWNALSQGEEGVTIQIDSDGDGEFEQTITTGETFTGTEITQEGDVNRDGVIDLADIVLIARFLTGSEVLDTSQQTRADVDNDGDIDLFDIIKIARFLAGLIDSLALETATQPFSPRAVQEAELTIEPLKTLTPGKIATLKLSSSTNLLGIQVGPQGRLTFDPQVIQIREIRGIEPHQVLAANIDNVHGEVRFVVLALGEETRAGFGENEEQAMIGIVLEAVGRSGESTLIQLQPDLALDPAGNVVSLGMDPVMITLGPPVALSVREILAFPNPMFRGLNRFVVFGQGIRSIRVEIYSLAGRKVFDSREIVGRQLTWHLRNDQGELVANGIYLYVVTVRGFNGDVFQSQVKKVIVLR